ncbi:hypothetical protein ACQ86G_14180 [Roseateles chitinivorans]|uniref:hypothetical protein n=1 Tax=Roseateles chitinivorans TaxID=2917965 RepID=UPI003D67A644
MKIHPAISIAAIGIAAALPLLFSSTIMRDPSGKPNAKPVEIDKKISPTPATASSPQIGRLEPVAGIQIAPTPSKREQVLRLARSSSPMDKFSAYKIVADCVASKEKLIRVFAADSDGPPEQYMKAPVDNESEHCGDISPAEIVQRLQWLDEAAAHGIRGAAQQFVTIGPDGHGHGDSDARNFEWEQRALRHFEAGARHGDVYSSLTLSDRFDIGGVGESNPSFALIYYELAAEAYQREQGKPLRGAVSVTSRLQSRLTKEELARVPELKRELLERSTGS